ncbi:MAG: efflux RND transporter periplasmic adaptor subunit [Chloroflexi bacterium]|nr:efflux RND transporter periplasmic adaptor subunit [Chloroflexota bacterium]
MKKRNIIIILVVALVLAGSIFGIVSARQARQSDSSDLITQQIKVGSLSAVVDETGEVHADQSAALYWETAGIVYQVNVSLGDNVKPDQVLAVLREGSLPQGYYLSQQELITATRALEDLYENAAEVAANAQSVVAVARDTLDNSEYHWLLNQPGNRASQETLKAAKAKVVIAEDQLKNKQKRHDNARGKIDKALTQILLTDAINQYQQAIWYENWLRVGADEIEMAILDANVAVGLANLDAAERQYERVKDGPDPDDITMAKARISGAQASVDSSFISAPFGGVITAVEALPGDLIGPNSVAFRIDNLDTLLVDVGVSEVDINQIKVGQPVLLSFDAVLGEEYQGEVVEVSPIGIQQQGLVSFEVSIQVLDADEDVRPGLTAAVQIVVRQVEGALLIPNRAVRWVKGEQVVYVSTGGATAIIENLKMIPVTLGASSDEFTEVLDGEINEGDFVVLNPPSISFFEEMEPGRPPAGMEGMR